MSQIEKLYDELYDGQPHRSDELLKNVYGSEHLGIARLAARIYDLKKRMDVTIRSWPDPEHASLTWYQLIKTNFNGVPIDEQQNRTYQTTLRTSRYRYLSGYALNRTGDKK